MIHKAVKYLSLCFVLLALSLLPAAAQQGSEKPTTNQPNPLIQALRANGVLSAEDVAKIEPGQFRERRPKTPGRYSAKQKGHHQGTVRSVMSQEAQSAAPNAQSPAEPVAQTEAKEPRPAFLNASISAQTLPNPTEPGAPSTVGLTPNDGEVAPALAPIRVFPVGGLERGKMTPAFRTGGVGITPYGFIKATMVEDSSSPQGDDAPLPYISANTGPNGDPEFHIKARSTRFGSNFEWYDTNPKWTITGKIEGDFEGNFSRADNRNLSTVRSSNPALRLAWGRLDYKFDDNNTVSMLFGQDWTTLRFLHSAQHA